jgi:AraC-like DNA-binding protein
MRWITRERPKIDRLACPWLIKRFIDPEAEIVYVPFDQVKARAEEWGATSFDIPGVEYTHHGAECTFDYFVRKYGISDPAVHKLATIVRGADTDRHELAPECAGVWAVFAGLAHFISEDQELLAVGLVVYDGLYAWAKDLQGVRHTQQPFEHLLLNVFHTYLKQKPGATRKPPAWVQELKKLIQDHIDDNLSLKEISRNLEISPSYLSREFSRYFGDLSFGEYTRKLRIEKAAELMAISKYSLTEIAYLTGFSDQSHFTRIFKQHTGKNPSEYRRELRKK